MARIYYLYITLARIYNLYTTMARIYYLYITLARIYYLYTTLVISSEKIYTLHGLKHHIKEISGEATDSIRTDDNDNHTGR